MVGGKQPIYGEDRFEERDREDGVIREAARDKGGGERRKEGHTREGRIHHVRKLKEDV